MRRPALVLTAPLVALALGLAACSGDDSAAPAGSGLGTGAAAAAPEGSASPVAAAAVAPAAADGVTRQATDGSTVSTRQVRVSATGSVSAPPDTLTLNVGVRTQSSSANDALRQTADDATAVIQSLKDAGVADDDITTIDVSVYPRYDDRGQQVTGYEASNTVMAKVRDLSKAGSVIDAAAAAAGDSITIGGISFSIDDPTSVYAQAREQAVKRSREQADQLAAAAGASVGQVLSIEESAQYTPQPMAYAAADSAGGASTPIQPGQTTVTLTVTVVYELVG